MDPSRERFPGVGVPAGAVLLAVVTLVVVGAIVALTVGRAGSGGGDASSSRPSFDAPVPTTTVTGAERTDVAPAPTAPPEPSTTPAAVRSVLRAYVHGYDAEDAEAAVATMSPGVSRRSGAASVQHGRREAMVEYQRQFDQLVHPRYSLGELSIAIRPTEARAHGRYTITSREASSSRGSITFRLVYIGKRLMIDRITAMPD
jgi:hypothetical protein